MRAIDLFAGAGGFTEGATTAGVHVVWAANHWPTAVQVHAANHPNTEHSCQDLHQADWTQVPAHDLLLASPACQGHSRARGKDRPHHDNSRSTAWAVVSALECHRTPLAIIENVPAFREWALYPAWVQAMHALGYALSEHVLDAAEAGVPQHRVRLFLVATRSRAPLSLSFEPAQAYASAGECIEWGRYAWAPVARPGRATATLRRWAQGQAQLGERFVMPYYGSGSGLTGRCLSRPLGTVTTRDRWALVNGDQMRMLQPSELARAMSFPDGYRLPGEAAQLACAPARERGLSEAGRGCYSGRAGGRMNCQREYYHNERPCEGVRSREALVERLRARVTQLEAELAEAREFGPCLSCLCGISRLIGSKANGTFTCPDCGGDFAQRVRA